jgi:hypothetical protein
MQSDACLQGQLPDPKGREFTVPCHLARAIRGECVTCGEFADPLHMPMETHGWFCAAHCPVCNGLDVPIWTPPKPPGQGIPTACRKCGEVQPSVRLALRHCRPTRGARELFGRRAVRRVRA